jgi:hypothetical protein
MSGPAQNPTTPAEHTIGNVTFGPPVAEGPLTGCRLSPASAGRRATALLPDGATIVEVRPARKRWHSRAPRRPTESHETRVQKILNVPEAYRFFDRATADYLHRLTLIPPSERGKPQEFPDAMLSFISALRHILDSHLLPLHDLITTIPGLVNDIWDGVVAHGTYPLTPAQEAARRRNAFPTRAALGRMLTQRFTTEQYLEALPQATIPVALELGYWTGGDHSPESLHNHIHADGTVLASPSKARRPQAICPKTGEVRNQRYDDAQGNYHEGGTEHAVHGTKHTFVAVGNHGTSTGFALALAPVEGTAPATEFQATIGAWERAARILTAADPAGKRRPVSMVVDGAPTGPQIADMVTTHNTLVSCPPKKRVARTAESPGINKVIQLVEELCVCHNCGVIENLGFDGSILTRWEPIGNKLKAATIPFQLKRTNAKGRSYFYLRFGCLCGADRLIPFTSVPSESPTAYNRRMDLMRGWAHDSAQWNDIYASHRGKVENTNKLRDQRYHFKRVPAYGRRNQIALLAQEEFSKAIAALADHRAAAQSPPSRHMAA